MTPASEASKNAPQFIVNPVATIFLTIIATGTTLLLCGLLGLVLSLIVYHQASSKITQPTPTPTATPTQKQDLPTTPPPRLTVALESPTIKRYPTTKPTITPTPKPPTATPSSTTKPTITPTPEPRRDTFSPTTSPQPPSPHATALPGQVILNVPGSGGNGVDVGGTHNIPNLDSINAMIRFAPLLRQWGNHAPQALQLNGEALCFVVEPHSYGYAYVLDKNNLWYGNTRGERQLLVADLIVPDYPNCIPSPNNNGVAVEIIHEGRPAVLLHLNPNITNVTTPKAIVANAYGNYHLRGYDANGVVVVTDNNGIAIGVTQANEPAIPGDVISSCQQQFWTIPHFQIPCP